MLAEPGFAFEHDGSFAGFLCAVAESLNLTITGATRDPAAVRGPRADEALFEERRRVQRDDGRAERLWNRLCAKAGEAAMRTILEAFCSDMRNADEAAAAMTVRLWNEGASALDELAKPEARTVEKAATRTRREAHLMTGLLRFAELRDGSLYATIEPSCDVLALMADHFAARFPALRWAVRDGRRGTAIVHEPLSGWIMTSGFAVIGSDGGRAGREADLPFSIAELEIRRAWARYFKSIAIESRRNPRLQASFMPKKHWKNLMETKTDS